MPRSRRHRWRRNQWFKRWRRRRRQGHLRGRRRYINKQGIHYFRFRATTTLTVNATQNQGYYTYSLSSCVPKDFSKFWDMYRILKIRVQWLPLGSISDARPWGATILDLTGRDTLIPTKGTTDFTIDDSTRRLWNPTRLHSRYFTPKPEMSIRNGAEAIQPNNIRNQIWIDSQHPETKHHGVGYYFDPTSLGGSTLKFYYTVTYYIQFRAFAGSLAP
ncbi:MAG: capsid protein [Circoviridae sp.]|nr:MAG: capsid protein [Circoviridae sp.]